MRMIMDAARKLAFYMHWISGVLLIIMMVTILLDVMTRAVFGATAGNLDLTFNGGVEIVSYSLLFCIMFSLPYSVRRGQVIVDLFTGALSERLKGALAGVYTLGFGLLGFGMCVKLAEAVERLSLSGETTQDLLIPMNYIYAVAAFAAGVLALRGLLVAIQQFIDSGR
ncbi:TRAP transporter small permease [Terasakiella pusilla]|uniref:TRAP transporter small permease n=1 Tax=Terasakiella pusilla TaxID=64973 RepID=UPI00056F6346|nr:TRAP transporter small permease [Terasakiella pusilla]